MPKKPVQMGDGKKRNSLIEDIIYNEKDYAFQAKVLIGAYSPAEIIKQLSELKQKIVSTKNASELRQFIYNSRLLLVELMKSAPQNADFGLISHYVQMNTRAERKVFRNQYAKIQHNPDILAEFHKFISTDHNRKTANRAILREVRHAWQSMRRVARVLPQTPLPANLSTAPQPEPSVPPPTGAGSSCNASPFCWHSSP